MSGSKDGSEEGRRSCAQPPIPEATGADASTTPQAAEAAPSGGDKQTQEKRSTSSDGQRNTLNRKGRFRRKRYKPKDGLTDEQRAAKERKEIEAFLKTRGPTKCPERYATGAIEAQMWTEI